MEEQAPGNETNISAAASSEKPSTANGACTCSQIVTPLYNQAGKPAV